MRIEKGTGTKICLAIVCGIVTRRAGKLLDSLSITLTANGRRQIQVENSSKQKMSRSKQLKTILMDKKLCETTNLGVEVMNTKRQEK